VVLLHRSLSVVNGHCDGELIVSLRTCTDRRGRERQRPASATSLPRSRRQAEGSQGRQGVASDVPDDVHLVQYCLLDSLLNLDIGLLTTSDRQAGHGVTRLDIGLLTTSDRCAGHGVTRLDIGVLTASDR